MTINQFLRQCSRLTLISLTFLALFSQSIDAFTVKKSNKTNTTDSTSNQSIKQKSLPPIIESKPIVDQSIIETIGTIHSFECQISVDQHSFIDRGLIHITFASANSNRATVKFEPESIELNEQQLIDLQQTIARNGLYRIRVRAATNQSNEENGWIVASTRACSLISSAFHDQITLHFDINGRLIAVNLNTPIAQCSNEKSSAVKQATLLSKGAISLGRSGIKPQNVRARLQPGEMSPNSVANESTKKEEEQSFFAKYWMYIVPFMVFVLVQAFLAPENKQGQTQAAAAAPAR